MKSDVKRKNKATKPGRAVPTRSLIGIYSKSRPIFSTNLFCPITAFLKSKPFFESKKLMLSSADGPQKVSDTIYEPADTSVAGGFVSLNKVYRFRLGGASNVTSTTGVINTYFSCDPSSAGTNFPEWSTLTSLFSEFRLVEYGVQFCSDAWSYGAYGVTAGAVPTCYIAGNLGTATAPGSITAVVDNADSCIVQFGKDSSTTGYTHVINGTGVNWSQVVTPTVTPYAGAPGCIQIYGSFGSMSQANALRCLIWGIYEFRSRV